MNTSEINSRIQQLEKQKLLIQSRIAYYYDMLKACSDLNIERTIKKLSDIQTEARRQLKQANKEIK